MNSSAAVWPAYYDVVILPPQALRDHAIELSRLLYSRGGQWRLGRRSFLPHISLYHIPVSETAFESFLYELRSVVDSTQWGELESTGFDMPVITLSRPDWLTKLHRRVVQRTFQYFNWRYGAEKSWHLDRFSGRRLKYAKQYLREYGTPMAGMNFRPHITLSSFKDSASASTAGTGLTVRPMRFAVDRLCVCELGLSHTCHRIVRQILPGE